MSIDKPGGGSDATPDRPREPERHVPRPDNPAARERAPSIEGTAPTSRRDRAAAAEAERLARIARRAEAAPPQAQAESPPAAARGPRPGDKGVITHFHAEYRGKNLDLYTDGTRWVSGDMARPKHPEKPEVTDVTRTDLPPTGKELVDEANERGSVEKRFRRELWESGDDVVAGGKNVADNGYDFFLPQPTGSHTGTAPQGPYFGAPQHSGIDVSTSAAALLVLGITADHLRSQAMEHLRKHSEGND